MELKEYKASLKELSEQDFQDLTYAYEEEKTRRLNKERTQREKELAEEKAKEDARLAPLRKEYNELCEIYDKGFDGKVTFSVSLSLEFAYRYNDGMTGFPSFIVKSLKGAKPMTRSQIDVVNSFDLGASDICDDVLKLVSKDQLQALRKAKRMFERRVEILNQGLSDEGLEWDDL